MVANVGRGDIIATLGEYVVYRTGTVYPLRLADIKGLGQGHVVHDK